MHAAQASYVRRGLDAPHVEGCILRPQVRATPILSGEPKRSVYAETRLVVYGVSGALLTLALAVALACVLAADSPTFPQTLTYANGDVYVGTVNGQRQGEGIYTAKTAHATLGPARR